MNLLLRFALRLVAIVDAAWLWARAKRSGETHPQAATAGAGVQSVSSRTPVELGEVAWPDFPSLAHAFWRAQEVTLFRTHRKHFAEPALDLGCGDTLFGQLAGFPANGYGVDYDEASLAAARQMGSRLTLLQGDAGDLPLEDGAVAVCLSNSVLEHLPDLDACFFEVNRVLQPGGLFLFSMTLGAFTRQLAELSGRRDAERWMRIYGHVQQPEEGELIEKLKAHGFSVKSHISYQPIRMTAIYRLLVSPAFQFVERRLGNRIRNRIRHRLSWMVIDSIRNTPRGAGSCAFVVAEKSLR